MRYVSYAVCRIGAKGGKFKFALGRSLNFKILIRAPTISKYVLTYLGPQQVL